MESIEEIEIFAEDVFSFVLNETCHFRSCKNLGIDDGHSNLTSSIAMAVRHHLRDHEEEMKNIFNTLLGHGNLNSHFREFTKSMTKDMFLRGYNPLEFVQFCTFMSKLGVLCYTNDYRDSMAYAIKAMVDVVRLYMKSGEFTAQSWKELNRAVLK